MNYDEVREHVRSFLISNIEEMLESHELPRVVSLTMNPGAFEYWLGNKEDFFTLVKRAGEEMIEAMKGAK
jgi:hypothetical protein